MKVLQVINHLSFGGAEKLVTELVPLLNKQAIKTDILSLEDKKTDFWNKLENESNVQVFGITKKSIRNPFLVFKIIPFLKSYDIIHIHLFPSLYWVVLAKLISFSNVKLVYTEHSTSNRRRDKSVLKLLERFIYKRLDKIVTIAEEVDSNLKQHLGFSGKKFEIINNGVDVAFYNSSLPYVKSTFFSDDDFIIIQVSIFKWQKDQNTLIKSLQHLPNNTKLLLVGEGNMLKESQKLVLDLNLEKRVKFLGNRNDVSKLLQTADVIVLSSKHEGLSLSNIEGMAAGKPFIGSNVPGIKEIVKDHGLLFEMGNERELASLINKLLINPIFYQQVAEKCYLRATEFDIKEMVSKYIALYQHLLNCKN